MNCDNALNGDPCDCDACEANDAKREVEALAGARHYETYCESYEAEMRDAGREHLL